MRRSVTNMQSTEATAQRDISQTKASSDGGCARARPWLHHNSNLWVFALPNGEGFDNVQAASLAAQMQDLDVTSPNTPSQAHIQAHTDHIVINLGQRFELASAVTTHATTPEHLQVRAMHVFAATKIGFWKR